MRLKQTKTFHSLLKRLESNVIAFCLLAVSLTSEETVQPKIRVATNTEWNPETLGRLTAVVYNRSVKQSKAIAEYYAKKRGLPQEHIFSVTAPKYEEIDRQTYTTWIEKPLHKQLENAALLSYSKNLEEAPGKTLKEVKTQFKRAKIKYLVLAYGMPLKISNDPALFEKGRSTMREDLRFNRAAVDNELAMLPILPHKPARYGPLIHHAYSTTNAMAVGPATGSLIVARLDGPTPEIAKSLVDKAIEAEQSGLWGKVYIDSRQITEGAYKMGDDWMNAVASFTTEHGWETVVHDQPATFELGFPMNRAAIYAGWYTTHPSGPFLSDSIDFAPGAIAYHLHSFSGSTVRSKTQHWVGPLLSHGATATLGCVYEPYLTFSPNVDVLVSRLLQGFTFGEAAYASMQALSWQTCVVGDPLYKPVWRHPLEEHKAIEKSGGDNLDWSYLRIINFALKEQRPLSEVIGYIQEKDPDHKSALLQEKLGDLFLKTGNRTRATQAYQSALQANPFRLHRAQLLRKKADLHRSQDENSEAYDLYRELHQEFPNHYQTSDLLERLVQLGEKLGRTDETIPFRGELDRLLRPKKRTE